MSKCLLQRSKSWSLPLVFSNLGCLHDTNLTQYGKNCRNIEIRTEYIARKYYILGLLSTVYSVYTVLTLYAHDCVIRSLDHFTSCVRLVGLIL